MSENPQSADEEQIVPEVIEGGSITFSEFEPIAISEAVHRKTTQSSISLTLIMIGSCVVLFIFFLTRDYKEASSLAYLGVGLGFLLVVTGIVMLFVRLKTARTESSEDLAVNATDLEVAVRQLGMNYDILRTQATYGFILAGAFMALGIVVILLGSVGEMFGLTHQGSNLTTIAGVVVEVVSGLGLYLFKQTFQQLNTVSDRLHETWKVLTAFRKADLLPDEQRPEVMTSLIQRLAGLPAKQDT